MHRKTIRTAACAISVAMIAASSLSGCGSSLSEVNSSESIETASNSTETASTAEEEAGGEAPEGAPGEAPGGPGGGPGGAAESTSKVSVTEGEWSFDLITTGEGDNATVTSTITYYAGKTDEVVIVPSVLGGAPVTEISSQAFGHHGEIMAVYVPDTVTKVDEWAFYDLNTASIISFANPDVEIDDAAFQSSGNADLYLPEGTSTTEAGGKTVISDGTELINLEIENSESAAIAGGNYLNVSSSADYSISVDDIASIAVSASGEESDVSYADGKISFSGDAYVAEEEVVEINDKFADKVSANDLVKTLWYLSEDDAKELNEKIASDESYSEVKSLLNYEEGYYINGNKVELADDCIAYDVKTGEEVEKDSETEHFSDTGIGSYKYMTYEDSDNDGKIDVIYYSPYGVNYSYETTTISSSNENLDGLSARDTLNPNYLSFANAVVKASGEGNEVHEDSLIASTSDDGNKVEADSNEERSIIWASDYASVSVDHVEGTSTSKANWAKMSYVNSLSAYNVEIAMEWGMNALLYATNGGSVTAGSLDGETSVFTANGDGANGVIAGGSGSKAGTADAPSDTANVKVYNAEFNLEGWNNHVADCVYGGYAYLEKVKSTTGKKGSYSVGQASAVANDFGNGVVDVVDFDTTVYGNRSAGGYVIGGGVITAKNSSFTSIVDSALVIASGGTYKVSDSKLTGMIGIRNRGGINMDSTSTFDNVSVTVNRDFSDYVTGDTAKKAVEAWQKASGDTKLIHYMMSDADMTIGQLCDNYDISEADKKTLLSTLSELAGESYTDDTPLRNSVLDNTYYNYSAGQYTGDTDYSDVPYLTVGSAYGGLVSSVMEFESAGENLEFTGSTFTNNNGEDYDYLIASEAGSAPVINFTDSTASGIIWNEGDVNRVVEGMSEDRSSSLTVNFDSTDFEGSFADGSNGLWEVDELSYTNGNGEESSLNGNYYGAESNYGITASFSGDSKWTVTHDSYLGSLTISDNASIEAPDGYELKMTVDGKETKIENGTYTGKVIITLVKK